MQQLTPRFDRDARSPVACRDPTGAVRVAVGISPTLAPHGVGLSHQVEEYWTTLKKGAYLIKCGRRGQPHIHHFRLSDNLESLVWESKGRLRRVPLNQVRKIMNGQQTQVFIRNRGHPTARGLEKMSMSLVYGHRQEDRTLDVMCQTEEEFNLWYHALKYVTDQMRMRPHGRRIDVRSPQQPSPPTFRGGGQSTGFVNQNLGFPASGNVPGDCYIWGAADDASPALKQSGVELMKVTAPHLVPSSQKLDIIYVACGPNHFTAVTRSGNLYTWGFGESGRLGLGSPQHVPIPTTVPKLRGVISVSCGDASSAAITSEGDLYTWGCGLSGQLGHGDNVTQFLPKRLTNGFSSEIKIRHIACGPFHSAAISEGGSVYTWGDGFGGKLGHGSAESLSTPRRIEELTEVLHVSCGWWHTAAVARMASSDDELESHRMALYTWGGHCSWRGDTNKGCLGTGAKTGEWLPTLIQGQLANKSVKSVACGLNLTVVLTRDGGVYQMGTTAAEDAQVRWEGATEPTRVEGPLKRIHAEQVACGKQHVIVVGAPSQSRMSSSEKKHQVFAWGTGKRGQLGMGTHKDHTTPQAIEELGTRTVVNVCCGGDYTLIVCAHDHKATSANTTEMMITPSVSDQSPTNSSGVPKRTPHHHHQIAGNGNVVTVNQLRLSKKAAQNHRDNVGSLDHISVASSSSSIRKMKSDLLFSGQRLDRNRTGSTPMSDVQSSSEQRTPHAMEERRSAGSYVGGPRSSTPTALGEGHHHHDGHRHGSVPDLTTTAEGLPTAGASHRPKFESIHSGDADSIASDPGDRGEESTSDDDASVANTDGQFPNDAYSEEDSSVHRSAPSLSEKGGGGGGGESSEQTNISKNLPESFKMPIMPFPPTTEVSPSTSTRSLSNSRSMASAARIRTRQRGLERRLGITDTWASDRLISKQSGSPRMLDLLSASGMPPPGVIREEGIQTARELRSVEKTGEVKETPNSSSQQHRRTASEQDVYLNSLRESLKNVGDSKARLENYGKLLESIEERLLALAERQEKELREANPELMSLLKLLRADESQQTKQISAFFEAETVEKTIETVRGLAELLETIPSSPPHESAAGRNSVAVYEQIFRQVKEMVAELTTTLCIVMEEKQESPEARPGENGFGEAYETSQSINNQGTSGTLAPVPSSSSQDGPTQLVHLWMERVDPGVSIVFQSTNQGTTKIKKIRFAKRMFAWDAAQRWWEQNQERLIRHYQLEPGFDPLNQAASDS